MSAAPPQGSSLFVCGSMAAWLAGRSDDCAARGIPVLPMLRELFETALREEYLTRWANSAATALLEKGVALLAIGGEQPNARIASDTLADRLAEAATRTLETSPAGRVFLEGGATASTVLRQLGLRRFSAQPSPGPGIGALLAAGRSGPLFLIKPGSYPWPDSIWPS